MLLSMTGHGEGVASSAELHVSTEVRSINNRFLKVQVRCSDGYGLLDNRIEDVVRQQLKRGTVTLNVRLVRLVSSADIVLNEALLEHYIGLVKRNAGGSSGDRIQIETLLGLPGVLEDPQRREADLDVVWPVVESSVNRALQSLDQMRHREGQAMADDMLSNLIVIEQQLEQIATRAPAVVEGYRNRLLDRLQKLLAEHGAEISAADLVREVGLFADRSDISEEAVRLRSHLSQFREIVQESDSNGRKLDFVTQEMFRETNTIGSKANDVEIARCVVEVKTVIERIREMVQNVE